MNLSPVFLRLAAFAALSAVLLPGCGDAPPRSTAVTQPSVPRVNLTGSWEMDYSQSDIAQQELDRMVRGLQKEAERRAQASGYQGPVGAGMVIGGAGVNSGSSIMGLARFADMITQPALLEIEQDENRIRIKREDDADLACEFHPGVLRTVDTPFGREVCGWQGHQLVFRLLLPDGLRIQHVLTAGADGQKLNVATTVATDQVTQPFTLNRVYNRFEPGESGFRCEMTLTKGRVCSTNSQ